MHDKVSSRLDKTTNYFKQREKNRKISGSIIFSPREKTAFSLLFFFFKWVKTTYAFRDQSNLVAIVLMVHGIKRKAQLSQPLFLGIAHVDLFWMQNGFDYLHSNIFGRWGGTPTGGGELYVLVTAHGSLELHTSLPHQLILPSLDLLQTWPSSMPLYFI